MPDRGLPRERTSLAWQRSGVNAALICGLAVLAAIHRRSPALIVMTAVLAAAGGATAGLAVHQATRGGGPDRPQSPWPRLQAVTVVAVTAAVAGVVLALV